MKKLLALLMTATISLNVLAEKLYIGTHAEFPPYEYLENNQLKGFDIELMEEIGKKIGYEIVWKDITFDGLISALQADKIDGIIAGMSPTAARKEHVDFSDSYLYFESKHYALANKKTPLKEKEELKGKIVGVQLGTIQEEFAKELGAKIRPYSSFIGAILDLEINKIDGVIISQETGDGYLKNMEGIKILGTISDKTPGVAIAFKKGNGDLVAKVNKALEELKGTETYDALVKKYFPNKVLKK